MLAFFVAITGACLVIVRHFLQIFLFLFLWLFVFAPYRSRFLKDMYVAVDIGLLFCCLFFLFFALFE